MSMRTRWCYRLANAIGLTAVPTDLRTRDLHRACRVSRKETAIQKDRLFKTGLTELIADFSCTFRYLCQHAPSRSHSLSLPSGRGDLETRERKTVLDSGTVRRRTGPKPATEFRLRDNNRRLCHR